MNAGMLWYDGDKKKTMIQTVTEAAVYFQKKYGRMPNMCIINSQDWYALPEKPPAEIEVAGSFISLHPWSNLPPAHIWIGRDGEPEPAPAQEPEEKASSPVIDAFVAHAQKASAQA